jgi:hypothetical protein
MRNPRASKMFDIRERRSWFFRYGDRVLCGGTLVCRGTPFALAIRLSWATLWFARVSLGRAMLKNLTEDVRLCYERAEWCATQAKTTVNGQMREDFLRLGQRWLKLARGYEIAGRSAPTGEEGK